MNWYKILILSQAVKDRDLTYLDIGHGVEEFGNNILWVSDGRSIKTEIESDEKTDHKEAFPFMSLGRLYTGRYEPSSGRLSMSSPVQGMRAHRDAPMSLVKVLYNTFPTITEIYTF